MALFYVLFVTVMFPILKAGINCNLNLGVEIAKLLDITLRVVMVLCETIMTVKRGNQLHQNMIQ